VSAFSSLSLLGDVTDLDIGPLFGFLPFPFGLVLFLIQHIGVFPSSIADDAMCSVQVTRSV
jgi:hypothetical protein